MIYKIEVFYPEVNDPAREAGNWRGTGYQGDDVEKLLEIARDISTTPSRPYTKIRVVAVEVLATYDCKYVMPAAKYKRA